MDNTLMVAYESREKEIGFGGLLWMMIRHPRTFFKQTVARDTFPFLAFTAWLAGMAHALMWMDKTLLSEGGLVSGQLSSFVLLLIMSVVFMGLIYMIGGILFHFYAYLADSRKDMKNSVAVSVYAWLPFTIAVFLIKLVSVISLGNDYLNPPAGWWFSLPSSILLGLSLLYGWFLAVYGAVVGLRCKRIRGIMTLVITPILWFVLLFVVANSMGMM